MLIIDKVKRRIKSFKNPFKTEIEILLDYGVKVGRGVDVLGSSIDLAFGSLLEIGNNVTITGTKILLHDASPTKFIGGGGGVKIRPVKIGNNVFIGYGSIILPGTCINDNVIVGAGTVVRGEIPGDSVIIGNPWQRICSFNDYIEHHKKAKEKGVFYTGTNFSEVAKMIEEGKDVYI